ncbi:MAG: T9SS type A sorting domain-containing protein [Bacteroidales bacterium]|nr:T9SS type A sorting domain-containing protein [Bacteroidales bacterium]
MKLLKTLRIIAITAAVCLIAIIPSLRDNDQVIKEAYIPNDWLLAQHVFPYGHLNPEAYDASRQQAIAVQEQLKQMKSGGEEWEFAGPMNVGGRISDVEMHPGDPNTIYACAASGGIYKSIDQGREWSQIFDGYETLSIGDMAVANTDKRILYVGTGEPNGGNGSITYDGYGVYKSVDEGASFTHVGLQNAGGIGKVEIDPTNPDKVFVACMGNLFSNNPERGIYRTLDGGETWENVLYISDSTGGIDLVIHPTNPDIVYATMWERVRYATHRSYGGPTSGLYRSIDGGDTWNQLTNGLPSGDISRIGLGMCTSQPNIIYAHYSDKNRNWIDLFKTTDGGDTWAATNSNIQGNYWEGKVHVDPTNPDILWSMGVYMHYSSDGAQSWSNVSSSGFWVDQHAVYVHPTNNQLVIIGNDGGVYISTDGSERMTKVMTLPITQFYTCEVNYHDPADIMGGTQDRGTQRSEDGDPMAWESINGGDGFIVRVDPSNPKYMYAASQRGGFRRSINGGDRFTGAKPASRDRYNWKTPYVLDPNDPKTIYLGSHRVYKSTTRAASWSRISNDLTNGDQPPWNYGTITTLAVSPKNSNIIYAGTDDGNVWVNPEGSGYSNWTKISDNLPVRWVSCVAADPFEENTAYVTFSGIRYYDYLPHVFKTTNLGASWTDISGNLPDFPVGNIQIDPDIPDTYYIATDGGVFVSRDGGNYWELMGLGMPNAPVLDLNIHRPTRTLVAATFGRSMWRINLASATGSNDHVLTASQLLAYPNPAIGQVNIKISLKSDQEGQLLIFNISGKLVKKIHEGIFLKGEQTIVWDGAAAGNNRVPGIYICRLVTNETTQATRVQIQ